MKPDIHPKYAPVAFHDAASGTTVVINSTFTGPKTIVADDGETYPVITLDISAASHPFYTGKQRVIDTAGRVDRFNHRRNAGEAAKPEAKSGRR